MNRKNHQPGTAMLQQQEEKKTILIKLLFYFIYCFIGTLATIYVCALGHNAIVASAIVGIIISFFTITINDTDHYSWASFCGSFAGMLSFHYLGPDPLGWTFFINAVILSSTAAFLYAMVEFVAFKYPRVLFDGYGGKLGTTAFISVLLYILIQNLLGSDIHSIKNNFNQFKALQWHELLVIPSAIIGSLISMEIKNTVSSLNDNYKVLTVAITGMIGGILITKISFFGDQFAIDLGNAWYTGAFVGMSSYFILMIKRDYFFTGLISGLLYILSKNLFIGVGGKLGFISFISVLIMRMIIYLYNQINQFKKGGAEAVVQSLQTGADISNKSVDDDYAQKLVETLKKAQQDGKDLSMIDNDDTGSFVIGEKQDYQDLTNEFDEPIVNESYLRPGLKGFIDFFHYLEIDQWIYLEKIRNEFSTFSYQGVDPDTVEGLQLKPGDNLIDLIHKEKRVIGFSKKGLTQPFFQKRISQTDFDLTQILITVPIFEEKELQGIFFLFDKSQSLQIAANNLKQVRHFFSENFIL